MPASSLPGLVALLATILAGIAQALWNRREARARVAAEAAAAEALRQRARQEREAEHQRAEQEREEREDREEISKRLGALETARGEHHSLIAGMRAELHALSAGQARLEEKTSQILDAVLDGTRRRRR